MPTRPASACFLAAGGAILLLGLAAGCKPPERKVIRAAPADRPPPASTNHVVVRFDEPDYAYEGSLKQFVIRTAASSTQGRREVPEHAFDDNRATRWTSHFQDHEWIEGRFEQPVGIRKITIHWETARAADFSVRLLTRQGNWSTLADRVNAEGLTDHFPSDHPVWTEGIRIECRRRATEWGNSIFEIDLEGVARQPPAGPGLTAFAVPATPDEQRDRDIARSLLEQAAADPASSAGLTDDQFLDLIARRSFEYLWWETNPTNGLTRDRGRNFGSSEEIRAASIAAVGFALTAYAIGAERGWVPREAARDRARITLRTFADGPVRHVRGCYPHFVDYFTGADLPGTEISTIDTALLLAGAIVAMEYFQDPEISELTTRLFERVEWDWYRGGHPYFVSHGLDPAGRMLSSRWGSFTEGILIYLLALGSPIYPLPAAAWTAIERFWGDYGGYRFLIEHGFQSMFRYQYPALWYDFRGRLDAAGVNYFDNVTRAALAMRAYCMDQAAPFPKSYGPDAWGLSAADGPGDRYMIYGFPPGSPEAPPDGTIVPYAVAGSLPFLPPHSLRALRGLYDQHRRAWGKYGFADSINPTLDFVARDALGLDAGTILLGIENYRTGFVWKWFMRNQWIGKADETIGWRRVPAPHDPAGPIDLMTSARWKFQPGDGPGFEPRLDDDLWMTILVPDFWEQAGPALADYDGVAWYRGHFHLDPIRLVAWQRAGRPIVLTLGGIADEDTAYVNGTRVGETLAGDDRARAPRSYTVPTPVLRVGSNQVAIRVHDTGGRGGIWNSPVRLGPMP
jgi:hypothetical protein